MRTPVLVLLLFAVAGCGSPKPAAPRSVATAAPASSTSRAAPRLTARAVGLPGASGAVSLDYLASDRARDRVWIPGGETGSVDVLDVRTGTLTRIEGFATAERELHGQKRRLGPSSVTIGDGVAYVGNRASGEVCAIDQAKLERGACVTLASPPDGMQYVAATREVWVTTPRDKSITIVDASSPSKLAVKARIALDGEPEGYAVDDGNGVLYTNLEDRDRTVAIDVRTRQITASWPAGCGEKGPRGLALDGVRGFLFVACTDCARVLDVAHGGALLSKLETGAGVDNIDYLDLRRRLYVVAGQAATLSVADVDERGALTLVATATTGEGTRVVVADRDGAAYVGDPARGQLLIVPSPP